MFKKGEKEIIRKRRGTTLKREANESNHNSSPSVNF